MVAVKAFRGDTRRVAPHVAGNTSGESLYATRQVYAVFLGPRGYALVWAGIYAIHATCALYCFAAGMLFRGMIGTSAAYYMDFYEVTLPTKYFHSIGIAHHVVGAVNCSYLVVGAIRAVVRIVKKCRKSKVNLARTTSMFFDEVVTRVPRALEQKVNPRLWSAAATVQVFARQGMLGIEFKHFDAISLVREVSETILKSYQAYEMCRQLARPGLNRFFVATLVANCWATPLLHHLVVSKPLQRLLSRVCDVLLDLFASVGVPLILVMSYVRAYDTKIHDFPYDLWYVDEWFVNALKESSLMFFGSWLDAVSRLVFSISLLMSLDDIKLLVCRRPPDTPNDTTPRTRSIVYSSPREKTRISRLLAAIRWLMFVYGIGVLAIHLHAELRRSVASSCMLEIRPWFISKPACVLIEVNCYLERSAVGNSSDFRRILSTVDNAALAQITVRHCRYVEVDPIVQRFLNMVAFKLYNSTLVTWDAAAALTETHHAKMRFLAAVRTQFPNATLPPGIIDHKFPRLLRDVEFSSTNLRTIPTDLDQRWPPGVALCLEFSE